MAWKRKLTGARRRKPTRNYSIVRKLRKNGQITEEFEVMLNSLALEDIIALKLELANRAAGGYLYGLPIWRSMPAIVKESVFKFAVTASRTKKEAMRFLGLSVQNYNRLYKQYNIDPFFKEDERLP
tara:strand:+ start:3370 stop:3747 length:378 start_codon:yes stop_codon:yes gene_type:complete